MSEETVLEELLSEFSDELREGGVVPEFARFVDRCPKESRQELVSLMNTLVLARKALASVNVGNGKSPAAAAAPAQAGGALTETP